MCFHWFRIPWSICYWTLILSNIFTSDVLDDQNSAVRPISIILKFRTVLQIFSMLSKGGKLIIKYCQPLVIIIVSFLFPSYEYNDFIILLYECTVQYNREGRTKSEIDFWWWCNGKWGDTWSVNTKVRIVSPTTSCETHYHHKIYVWVLLLYFITKLWTLPFVKRREKKYKVNILLLNWFLLIEKKEYL